MLEVALVIELVLGRFAEAAVIVTPTMGAEAAERVAGMIFGPSS
jgi:hypothetical protein